MDMKKTGELIAQCRKDLGLTQQQLADTVGVTYKAISRWETGRGFPDAAYLQPLSRALGISITEIVNGELTHPETAARQADDALLAALTYSKQMSGTFVSVVLVIVGFALLIAPQYVTGINTDYLPILGTLSLLCAVVLRFHKKWPLPSVSKILAAAASLIALVLQILPLSAVMVFKGPDYYSRNLYSCFDPMLWGYASFGPPLSAVLSAVVLLLLALVHLGKKNTLRNAAYICTILSALLMAIGPVMLGGDNWSVGRIAVIFLQLFSAFFQARCNATLQ